MLAAFDAPEATIAAECVAGAMVSSVALMLLNEFMLPKASLTAPMAMSSSPPQRSQATATVGKSWMWRMRLMGIAT